MLIESISIAAAHMAKVVMVTELFVMVESWISHESPRHQLPLELREWIHVVTVLMVVVHAIKPHKGIDFVCCLAEKLSLDLLDPLERIHGELASWMATTTSPKVTRVETIASQPA